MTKKIERQVAQRRNLFGPPPVLSSEDRDHYDEMWDKLTECPNVKDFVELMFVTQVMNETWRISRYVRHDALAVERRFRQVSNFRRCEISSEREEGKPLCGILRRNPAEPSPIWRDWKN